MAIGSRPGAAPICAGESRPGPVSKRTALPAVYSPPSAGSIGEICCAISAGPPPAATLPDSQHLLLSYTQVMALLLCAPRPWVPAVRNVALRQNADALADVTPLLARIVEGLGTNAAARLLGADRAQVSRWSSGKESIGQEMGRRIVDLHDILTRIIRVVGREAASLWLVGSEPLLGGARPIDVLVTEGAAPVVRAIDGIAAGAYA